MLFEHLAMCYKCSPSQIINTKKPSDWKLPDVTLCEDYCHFGDSDAPSALIGPR